VALLTLLGRLPRTAAAIAAVASLTACTPKAEDAPAGVAVSAAWLRTPPPGAPTAAGYATLTNTGGRPDRLVGVSSPIAASAMLHRSAEKDGMMTMSHVSSLELPPGKAVVLAPGGYHLMLVGLNTPLAPGAAAPVELTFERAGVVKAELRVAQQAPAN
jgi:periplasmic copper chaperone A